MDGEEPGSGYLFAARDRLFVDAGAAEEKICGSGESVDGVVGSYMIDDVNRDAALFKCLSNSRNFRRLFMLDPSPGKHPDWNIASLHEEHCIRRGENDG